YEMGMEAGLAKGRIEGIRQGEECGKIIGREEGEERGKILGAVKSLQKFGQSKEATLSYIREEFQLSGQEAAEYVDGCWDGSKS
ncbi:MAG: hypothetical protein NC086_03975, partial [Alistipes sp.]|nr:hypothetical protein [Alistipes sp.]